MTKQADTIKLIKQSCYFNDSKSFEKFNSFLDKLDRYSSITTYGECLTSVAYADKSFMDIYNGKKPLFLINPIAFYGVQITQSKNSETPNLFNIKLKWSSEVKEEMDNEFDFIVDKDGAVIFSNEKALEKLAIHHPDITKFLIRLTEESKTILTQKETDIPKPTPSIKV